MLILRGPVQLMMQALCFTAIGTWDPLLGHLGDAVVHRECLSLHPRRDNIVATWNTDVER